MPEPARNRGSGDFGPSKLIAYSVAGLLLSLGLCGLGGWQSGWLVEIGRTLLGIGLFTLPFGIVWAVAEAIVDAFSKKSR